MLEEERKKAEFHANPLPSYLNVKKEIPIPSTRSYTLSKRRTLYKFELVGTKVVSGSKILMKPLLFSHIFFISHRIMLQCVAKLYVASGLQQSL